MFKTSHSKNCGGNHKFTTVNKIADKKLPQNNLETNEEILREKYLSPELRQKIIDDLRVMDD